MDFSEALNLGLILLCLGALMALAEWLRRKPWAPPEFTRKLVHLGGGVVVYFLPYAFDSHWPVLALALVFLSIALLSQRFGKLQSVHGVNRNSMGAWVYPLTVYALFLLAAGNALIFQIPILILAFSDAFGALVGKTYGMVKYKVMDQIRSLEGSTVFFVVAFLVTHIPLLLSEQTGRWEAVLIALVIALLATCFEAVSLGGSDNVLVPFGVYFLLLGLLPLNEAALEFRALLLIGLLLLALLTARWQQMSASGAIGALLVGYAVWTLAGVAWFAPMLVFYLTFNLVERLPWTLPAAHAAQSKEREIYEISAVFYVTILSVVLVFASTLWAERLIWLAFLTTVSANAAISWATLLPSKWFNAMREVRTDDEPKRHFFGVEWGVIVLAGALPLLSLFWFEPPFALDATAAAMVLAGAVLAVLAKLTLGRTLRAEYRTRQGARVSKPNDSGHPTTYVSGVAWMNTDRAHLLSLIIALVLVIAASLLT